MLEFVNELINSVLGSPWAYPVIFLVVGVDAFFPAVPGEVVVVAAGVLAAGGEQDLASVIAFAALGAFAGDHVSYFIGYAAGRRAIDFLVRGKRGRAIHESVRQVFEVRGGVAVIVLRFVSGGRTATTIAAGALRYPLIRFAGFDAVAALLWAHYVALLGYWAGDIFQGRPFIATFAGLGLSIAVALLVEGVRAQLRRRRARSHVPEPGDEGEVAPEIRR